MGRHSLAGFADRAVIAAQPLGKKPKSLHLAAAQPPYTMAYALLRTGRILSEAMLRTTELVIGEPRV
jgi:hypothetical protein